MQVRSAMICEFTYHDTSRPETTGVVMMNGEPGSDEAEALFIFDMKGNKISLDDVRDYQPMIQHGVLTMPVFQGKQERDMMKLGLALLQN